MANPSSSHHDRDRDRERVVRERSHHHHRTISSTTLLLILSLVLAVLAVMLSLPSTRSQSAAAAAAAAGTVDSLRDSTTNGAAKRESEVAQREADILANALVTCAPYATVTEYIENIAPPAVQTIFREIINEKEVAVTVPAPPAPLPTENTTELTRRIEDLISRESKVADRENRVSEREKDMSRREEAVNRREHDAQRRESWIMEQFVDLGEDPRFIEEYIIDQQIGKRKVKVPLSTPRRSEL
ncbi:hypothetical protein EW145_g1502 [Phellinidium pouzarii]|uniref:Uncharacterized protein n=1 Tax=Phellinidium pouzarii TaxID=167371 RepID=A0A4S4LEL3_9AGAM|nr:hypothetical protein EW145_g1502 [Phellinidium pouzarii]